jgi:hypothetical protein
MMTATIAMMKIAAVNMTETNIGAAGKRRGDW